MPLLVLDNLDIIIAFVKIGQRWVSKMTACVPMTRRGLARESVALGRAIQNFRIEAHNDGMEVLWLERSKFCLVSWWFQMLRSGLIVSLLALLNLTL